MPVSAVSSSAAAQTLYPQMVNGYLCYDAADVLKAQRFANPHPLPAVRSKPSSSAAATRSGGAPPVLAGYTAAAARGRRVDIYA